MLGSKFDISFLISTDDDKVIDLVTPYYCHLTQPSVINNPIYLLPLLHNADIAILDFYTINEELQLSIKNIGIKLVCIDDLHKIHFYADIVINVSNNAKPENYHCEAYTKLCLGTNYALLRPDFLRSAKTLAKKIENVSSLFINMGGADVPNNTLKFLKAAVEVHQLTQIHLVIGLVNPHRDLIAKFITGLKKTVEIIIHSNIDSTTMNNLLLNCQLGICPASGISMELASVGLGMITGYTADNQKDLLEGIVSGNCALNLENMNLVGQQDIIKAIDFLVRDVPKVNQMIINQKKLIDGRSDDRLRKVFEAL